MTKIRRMIHQNPEIGLNEYGTTNLVKKELMEMGVEVREINSKIGVLGIIHGLKRVIIK